jgi:hypothetical protein
MYDYGVALRRFDKLIRWTARKYQVLGHHHLMPQDIQAEGYLVLVRCCQRFPPYRTGFARFFKRSWYNRLKDLSRFSHRQARDGVTVEIPETLVDERFLPSDNLRSRISELKHRVSPLAFKFLRLFTQPNEAVTQAAWRDFCRKNKLAGLGIKVTGFKKFRIRPKHVQTVLGIPPVLGRKLLRELKQSNQQQKER